MKKIMFILVTIALVRIINAQTIDYLGQVPPIDIPIIFAPGIVSVENKNTHALIVSPDGKMIIFSRYPDRTSYILSKENDKWTVPVESFFYGKEVSFSPDGNRIYYYTNSDIYFVERNSSRWNQPVKLGSNVNTNNQIEYYPCIVKNGDLYFSRDGNWATGRLMHSKFQNGEFQTAVDLGLPINSGGALHAFVAPDESYILFNSPRTGSYTKNDIWISFRNKDGSWSEPKNLGKKINSGADAILCPTVSPNGKFMFFTKLNFNPTTGYIYWVSTSIIDSLRKTHQTRINDDESMYFPPNFELNQNYPNPFNPSTVIGYQLNSGSNLKLTIYNLLGRNVKTLIDSFQNGGEHSIVWDGTDDFNNQVSSGVYLISLETNRNILTKKMILLR